MIGRVLKRGLGLTKMVPKRKRDGLTLQKNELRKLLFKANQTLFGQKYGFAQILLSMLPMPGKRKPKDHFYQKFKENIPIFNYNSMFQSWWHMTLEGKKDVCWPGQVKYFALSSGTSESSTKHIPITSDMLRAIRKTSLQQILSLKNFDIPSEFFSKGVLMLGGSTQLQDKGHYYEGDLSGITTGKLPFWFHYFYKPGKALARTRDWTLKLDKITQEAQHWDIGSVAGVPAWIQLMMERIIEHYKVDNIHDIWPNFSVYTHGGVAFEPYKKSFEKLLGKPVQYIETYLASEGFIAFQDHPDEGIKMVLNKGIFYEFIPFDERYFDVDGELLPDPQTYMIHEVEEGKEYALLLSTCAGAWRYLIGDVVKIIHKNTFEIKITGRTKHYLSLCGEHLSVDNMNKAIELVAEEFNLNMKEFCVAGIPYQNMFAHHWYLGVDEDKIANLDPKEIQKKLDSHLKELNDDYRTERIAALKEVMVTLVPTCLFYDWLKTQGKEGGQSKFPRVLKKEKLESWESFLKQVPFKQVPIKHNQA